MAEKRERENSGGRWGESSDVKGDKKSELKGQCHEIFDFWFFS
jgi:hypothetical protein